MLALISKAWFNEFMLTSEAIAKFGSIRALARDLDISVQAIYAWGDTVPPLRAYQIRDLLVARTAAAAQPEPQVTA